MKFSIRSGSLDSTSMSKVYRDEWLWKNPVTGKMEWTRVPPPELRNSTPKMYKRVRRSVNSMNYG